MAVTVDIPGIGPVIASNAAENSTLQAILEATNRMGQRLGAQRVELGTFQRNADKAANALGDIANAADDAADATDKLALQQQRAYAGFQRSMSQAGASFKGMFSSRGDFASGIAKIGDSAASLIKGGGSIIDAALTKRFGFLGSAAGKAATTLGALGGFVAGTLFGEISKVVGGFEELVNSGGSFGYSMNAFTNAAIDSGLSVAQFGRVMKEAAPSLASFGGNTREGGRQFARFMGNLRNENLNLSKSMRLMGVAYDAQGVMLADYTANLAKSGVAISNVNTDDVVKGFFELTKQQRMFAQYNGITLDQQRELQKQARENVSVEAVIQSQGLIGQAAEEFRAKYAQITQQYGDAAGQLFLQQREFGGAVTETAAAVEMMNPQLANMTRAAGATGADLATMQRTMLDPETQRRATREMGQLAVLGVAGVNDSLVSAAGEMMMKLRDDLPKQIGDVMTKITTDMGKMIQDVATGATENIGDMSRMFTEVTSAVQDFRNALTAVTGYVMETGIFQKAVDTLTAATTTMSDLIAGRPVRPSQTLEALNNDNHLQRPTLQDMETNPQKSYLQGWGANVEKELKTIRENQEKGFQISPRPETLTPEERSRSFPITPRPVNPRPRPDADTISSILPIMNQQQVDGFEEAGQAASRANPQLASLIDRINGRDQEAMDRQRELVDSQTKTNDAINQSNQQMANLSNILREGLRTMNTTLDDIATNTA